MPVSEAYALRVGITDPGYNLRAFRQAAEKNPESFRGAPQTPPRCEGLLACF